MSAILKFIEKFEPDFNKVNNQYKMDFTKEANFARQILEKNDYLLSIARSNPDGLKDAVINITTTGLSLNPFDSHAYLVPRDKQVCLDVSYKGMMHVALQSGDIKHIVAEIVYPSDEFVINGELEPPTHKRNPFKRDKNEKPVGAYCYVKTSDNVYLTTAMTIEEIIEIRNCSESWKNERSRKYSPWFRFESEMIKKTVIKRAAKMWPIKNKNRLNEIIGLSNEVDPVQFAPQIDSDINALDSRTEEQKIVGDDYVFCDGKFRDKRMGDIEKEDLLKYYDFLTKKIEKENASNKQFELHAIIDEYLMMLEG